MTVARTPARALNPRVPMTAPNRLLTDDFWAGIGYRVDDASSDLAERTPIAMKKWEYLTTPLMIHNTAAILNNWGDQGWELVQVVTGPEGGLVAYLKREKEEDA
jgi:hypothetical protein